MAKTYFKQPSEVVDYFIDMREYFAELGGDFINIAGDIDVTIDPAGSLVAGSTVLVNGGLDGFTQWFSGGTDNVRYKVTYVVTTNVGRVEEFEMYIKVKET
jgi:hypothetical protein